MTPTFVGAPCGQYGPYTFHKGFKFLKGDKFRVINLGEFFFVRISRNHDPCIGELQLLWNDQNGDQRLSSVRLYFLPEQTPDGRLSTHGEDEVLVASDNVVLKLDDLVSWITDEVDWNHGLLAICEADIQDDPQQSVVASPSAADAASSRALDERSEDESEAAREPAQESIAQATELGKEAEGPGKKAQERKEEEAGGPKAEQVKEQPAQNSSSPSENTEGQAGGPGVQPSPRKAAEEKASSSREKSELADVVLDRNELRVMVLSYPSYCRYRSILKRLDGVTEKWLKHALVVALGGFTTYGRNTHILFCRDSFDHEELAHHELNCEYLAPRLKVKRRRKKGKNIRSTSPGSESNTSEESKDLVIKTDSEQKNGFKPPPYKTEQEFLQRLYKFMKKRKTPIQRVPHLGFKQIDLFVFFSFAQKLGGYDKITGKKLWKHVYDELGGDPGSTSAATCTRRHYEKLLLPFERFMHGKDYKPKQSRKSPKPSGQKAKESNDESAASSSAAATAEKSSASGKTDDTYAFTDSTHDNSKDSTPNEEHHSSEDRAAANDNFSDEDDKPIWFIQKAAAEAKQNASENADNKQIKPLVIQKEQQNESFSEKERRWNEIRKKNALARKRVRQLRPSRGGKSLAAEKLLASGTEHCLPKKTPNAAVQLPLKPESSGLVFPPQVPSTDLPPVTGQQQLLPQVKQEKPEPDILSQSAKKQLEERPHVPSGVKDGRSQMLDSEKKPQQSKAAEQFVPGTKVPTQAKAEPTSADKKPWSGVYSTGESIMYQFTPDRYPYACGFDMNVLHNFIKQEYKPYLPNKASYVKPSCEPSTFSSSDTEQSHSESKPNLSQRRPSVIQHTEFVTSPSPSQSPKQMNSEVFSDTTSRDSLLSCGAKAAPPLGHTPPTVPAKVFPEWLSKGIPEAVACKTPAAPVEKVNELHDKAMMPSGCKTLLPGTSKTALYTMRNKTDIPGFMPTSSKPVRDKAVTNTINVDAAKKACFPAKNTSSVKLNPSYQKTFHPSTVMTSSLNMHYKPNLKIEQNFSAVDRNKQYGEPFYNQPKRHKLHSIPPPAPIPPRPSLLPFTRQQTYRTSPLSDIPKTSSSSAADYDSMVLDLSIKKKTPEKISQPKLVSSAPVEQVCSDEPVCLDLSMKKKPSAASSQPSSIENITPPLPASPKSIPNHTSNMSQKPLKPLPTLISLQDLMREEAAKQRLLSTSTAATTTTIGGSTSKPSSSALGNSSQASGAAISSLPLPSSNAAMFQGNAQGKIAPNFFPIPPAFTKEMAESLYMASDPTKFPPYVIPPFYAAGWPPTEPSLSSSGSSSSSSSSTSKNTSASPNAFKEAVNHNSNVFPKQYLYNYKHQFHPLLCKDNGYYPPSCK